MLVAMFVIFLFFIASRNTRLHPSREGNRAGHCFCFFYFLFLIPLSRRGAVALRCGGCVLRCAEEHTPSAPLERGITRGRRFFLFVTFQFPSREGVQWPCAVAGCVLRCVEPPLRPSQEGNRARATAFSSILLLALVFFRGWFGYFKVCWFLGFYNSYGCYHLLGWYYYFVFNWRYHFFSWHLYNKLAVYGR